ncbi:hypothetical protein FHR90_001711 [Endobacter medicaginis]|uniref:PRC-barrel domain-containing protein n=1 Tax=Endobacter medicaginis TaxID=1181271 RepID=A0A839V2X4_9PROT|nr:hypothetical protein [Endobacter medicaginis]MBB3173879.1 hypothetical protein [Endobacter medicaginis]
MLAASLCGLAGAVAEGARAEPSAAAAPASAAAPDATAAPSKPAISSPPAPPAATPTPPAPISSVFGQTAWQPPAPSQPSQAALSGGVPVSAPSSAAEASLRVSSVHLLGLVDHAVEGSDHTEIGHVIDVLVDEKGDAAAVVIEIAGFMGVGNRHIALAIDLLTIPPDLKGALRTALSPAQLRSAPTYDAKPGVVTVVSGAETAAEPHPDHAEAPKPTAAPAAATPAPGVAASPVTAPAGTPAAAKVPPAPSAPASPTPASGARPPGQSLPSGKGSGD